MENKMKEIKMDKIVLSAGATGDNLDKAFRLLERISGRKPIKTMSMKRIPSWEVRPKLEVGCKVTLRKEDAEKLLKRLLAAVENHLKKKQIARNHFSFGIKEYIEIPDMEYQRDIGIIGFNVTVDFIKMGARTKRKKIKRGSLPEKQGVSEGEIEEFMIKKYGVEII
ncbi:50S ribosomal protein L5 [Candidatus Pacearchaeota archaeon]|nr:50S ribosomal protein L5 [Candidatus Pacearchaeota archaeon]